MSLFNFSKSGIADKIGNALRNSFSSIASSAKNLWNKITDKSTYSNILDNVIHNPVSDFLTKDVPNSLSESVGETISNGISPVIEGIDDITAPIVEQANDPQTFSDPVTGDTISEQIDDGTSARQLADENLGFMNQLIGSLSGENQRILQELQREAAQEQYKYSMEMSSTAYQRAVTDMRKAGLNPAVMFAGNGASAASTPQVGIASVASENQLLSNISSAAQIISALGSVLKGIGEIIPL